MKMKKIKIEYVEIKERSFYTRKRKNKAIKDIILRDIRNLFENEETKVIVNQFE